MEQQRTNSRRLVVLGSTGSVGSNTLEVAALHPDRYEVAGLSAHSNIERLKQQVRQFRPELVAIEDQAAAKEFNSWLVREQISGVRVLQGKDMATTLVEELRPELVMAAIVGSAGLPSALRAVELGLTVLIANKEPLVMAGHLFKKAADDSGAVMLPVDSEHNAIFQCVAGTAQCGKEVRDIVLTASGGPFFRGEAASWNDLDGVTPEQAVAHPNWNMGAKISVDSATMMNKGLEIIEAGHLFELDVSCISVLLHPQSVVHAIVNFVDGSSLAQLGLPDMRIPIANAMAWPQRLDSGVASISLSDVGQLEFREPDYEQMPCLKLAKEVADTGSAVLATSLNAANEVAVEAFLNRAIAFTRIPQVIAKVLGDCNGNQANDVETLIAVDKAARLATRQVLESV